ncbi:MAG: hypothetical protein VXY16_09815 [Pseudomonadota bacterium]|nr:hypothetical protein [Pseudomonadota bacterium]
MGSTLRKSGLTALFTAAAFSLFSAYATPVMAQANPTDLVETFGDQVEQGDAVQQLVDMLNDGGFQLAGMGTTMGQQGPVGYIAVFANSANEWKMVSIDRRFASARVVNEGTTFSTINYRYNIRINYDAEMGGAQLIPVQSQGGDNGCGTEEAFGRNFIKENYATGYLMQGIDSDNDIMKIFINDEGGFLGSSTEQDFHRTTCPQFQGESFRIGEDFMPTPRVAP